MSKPLVLFHASCADGFCAAWAAWRVFAGECECVPVNYGQEPPDVCGRKVYILDFSYKRPVMMQIFSQAHSVCVLDHHGTAQTDLTFPSCTEQEMKTGEGRIFIRFDLQKSGGRLAWEYFFPDVSASWLVDYTEDRDLWKWQLPHSREVSAALASLPHEFPTWNDLHERFNPATDVTQSLAQQGTAILRYQQQQVDSQCKNAVEIEMDGHKVLSVNATMLISEIAGKLAEGRPFGATWFERSDGKRVWSLRSRDGGVDVSEIAKKHGGGGHRNAAGFEVAC